MNNIVVFNGSPRRNGTTNSMTAYLLDRLEGQKHIVPAYRTDVAPCIDCRYCWKTRGCSIKDAMQDIYALVDAADLLVFASPVYFFSVTAPLKLIIDRMQVYWAGLRRGDRALERKKVGAILLCGGAPPFPRQFESAELLLRHLLKDLSSECAGMVTMPDTDRTSLSESLQVRTELEALAESIFRSQQASADGS